jgi:ATP-binding cassette subfamily B protein
LEISPDGRAEVPPRWREAVRDRLESGESIVAHLTVDLDESLRFAESLVVLTDRRLINWTPDGAICEWPLASVASIEVRDRSGLGSLDLIAEDRLLTRWKYTAARVSSARRLADKFEAMARPVADVAEGSAEPELAVPTCVRCGGILSEEGAPCPDCVPEPRAKALAMLRLVGFARKQSVAIFIGFVLTALGTAAGLVPPYLTQPLIDDVLVPRQSGKPADFAMVRWYVGLMVVASVLSWLLGWLRNYVMGRVSERISAELRDQLYKHLLKLSLEFFGGKRTGDLMSRIGSDTDRICTFLSVNLVDFANDLLMIAGTAWILIVASPTLAAAALIPLPLGLVVVHWVRGKLRRGFAAGSRAWSAMTSVLADTIPGIRVVKAFAQEGREFDRFQRSNLNVVHVNDRVNNTWAFFGPMIGMLSQVGLLFVWIVGAWLVFEHDFKVGLLTMYLTYLGRFYTRLESMSRMVQATQRAAAGAQRIFEILDRSPRVAEPSNPIMPGNLKGMIELRGVGFRHGNRRILEDINLKIRPGEMIGLVGPSGAGKSTLVNLICRFYDVLDGAILVDGVDIRSFPISEYRQHIGIVLQEPFLFFGTIAENISYGNPGATRAEIVAAARAARAHEFILRFADGYDSLVGERGQSLSGGERQRISIARALLIDPTILILDEATSSVDTETEREIQAALDNLIKGRTTIAIAHRLSTLRKADRVVVLEDGRVSEIGPHRELVGHSGTYSRLHRAQLEMAVGADLE